MKILVVSVHPDDETIGCGGTLLKHKWSGDQMAWLIITNVKKEYGFSDTRVLLRNQEIELVAKKYGFSATYNLGFRPAGLTSENQSDLINEISSVFNEFEPDTIYLINRTDAHSDHRFAFQACYACTKSFRYPFIRKVLMYECISETEFAAPLPENVFIPNYFVDISSFLQEKISIMEIFQSELAEHPFPRSKKNMEALAIFRGASIGVEYAEAFQIVKFIEK